MDDLSFRDLRRLIELRHRPCVSLYMPTHRHHPGTEQDPIRFRGLVARAVELVGTAVSPREAKALLAEVEALDEPSFWRHQYGGLAVFRSPELFASYRLPMSFPDTVVVSETFHTRPLFRYLRASRRFFVLALARNSVSLFEGTRWGLEPVEGKNLPSSLREALGEERAVKHLDLHSTAAGGGRPVYHGHGTGGESRKDELTRYFREIDGALWEYLRDERVPLVLAGVGYYHPIYRQVSRYPNLLPSGVEGNVERDAVARLHERAWALVADWLRQEEGGLVESYGAAAAAGRASEALERVAEAVVEGRVATLLLAEDRHVWGRLDAETGEVEVRASQQDAEDADVLDDLGEIVLRRGGEVVSLSPDRMPSAAPAAAIFRY